MPIGNMMKDGMGQAKMRSTLPIRIPKSVRQHNMGALTSGRAGKMVPLAAAPLLREDAVRQGQITLAVEMNETADILANAVHIKVRAFLVPFLAFDRFNGMDDFNRSYNGEVTPDGEVPVDFFETIRHKRAQDEILQALGLHARENTQVNTMYYEAYNAIWNHIAKEKSQDIELRGRLDKTLAPAFWIHDIFEDIVADFDQAEIDGKVPLNITDQRLRVSGLGKKTLNIRNSGQQVLDGVEGFAPYERATEIAGSAGQHHEFFVRQDAGGVPELYAELERDGIEVSLANIEAAKKTAAFAKLMRRYEGHDEDYVISMLMNGIRIPDQDYKQPILLSEQQTIFGMSQRYATNGEDLTKSVTSGASIIDLKVRTPPVNTGGVVMVTAECLPQQVYERKKDPFLSLSEVDELPAFLRDEMDPEKVEVVTNETIDINHDEPKGVFGYRGMNGIFNILGNRIGGEYYRPNVDEAFSEIRQIVWAVETKNPKLTEDHYVAHDVHQNPFADRERDGFKFQMRGGLLIEGNTVFGGRLMENNRSYESLQELIPEERIEQPRGSATGSRSV